MYQTHKTYIKPDMRMSDLIHENPTLLLMMEHLGIDFIVQEKTVAQICSDNKVGQEVFLVLGNLYNGFNPTGKENYSVSDAITLIQFLKNSHTYYKQEKYPEINNFIMQLYKKNNSDEIKMIETFFKDYFKEVTEHLDYEEEIAFPYFCNLVQQDHENSITSQKRYSAKEYREHHTDIETKLADLRNLLLKHISVKNDRIIRRKLLFGLFELELDLEIHSIIEEIVLIPLIEKIETNKKNG